MPVFSLCPLRIPLRTLRLKKREFNRKDAKKCKVRKGQFHAVYSIYWFSEGALNVSANSSLVNGRLHDTNSAMPPDRIQNQHPSTGGVP